jgi:hypothetical protein
LHVTPRTLLLAILTSLFLLGVSTASSAVAPLPSAPQTSGMVDRRDADSATNTVAVRTIAQAGDVVWVGGLFSEIDGTRGNRMGPASGLAAFDAATGLPVDVHVPLVTSSQGVAEVFDSSVGPDGILYFAGHFDAVDGQERHGAAAIDPATGAVLPFAPNVGNAHTILATGSAVYIGGRKLISFHVNGKRTAGFVPAAVSVNAASRTEMSSPQFRDIVKVGSTLVAACQCDTLVDAAGTHAVKAVVKIDAATGRWLDWAPSDLTADTPASGLSVIVHVFPGTSDLTIYLAAGGSDFTAAYDFVTGGLRWGEDTSGSSQAIAWYRGYLVVGGHFDWTQAVGGPACNDNETPNRNCLFTPKLVALSASTGAVLLNADGTPWNPGICCRYNGVWALLPGNDGITLNVGGEFTKTGGSWTCKRAWGPCFDGGSLQKFFARFAP